MAKKVVKIIGLTASGETTATPIGEIVGLISDAIKAKESTASRDAKVPVVKASFSPSIKPTYSGSSSSTSFSITGETKSLAEFNETGSGLASSDIYHGSDGYGVGTPEPFWKWDVNQGSINITQGSDTDGYRINGKLVVNIIDSEVILGNTTYNTVKAGKIYTSEGKIQLLQEGNAATAIEWLASNGDVLNYIKPSTDGLVIGIEDNFALTIDTANLGAAVKGSLPVTSTDFTFATDSTSWMLNGNTIGAKKTIGSLDAYDVGIIRGGTEIATIKSTGVDVVGKITATSAAITGLTTNYLPKVGAAGLLGNSVIYDNGTNVGVGTLTPLGQFQVGNSATARIIFSGGWLQEFGTTGGSGISSNIYYSGGYKYRNSSYAAVHLELSGGDYNFKTAPTGTADNIATLTSRLIIKNTGNVGIGTASPAAKLDIVGSIGLLVNNNFISTGGYNRFQNNGISIGDIGSGNQIFSGGTLGDLGLSSRSGKLGFGTGSVQRMTIDASGNVGIGTVSPTERIETDGNIKLTSSLPRIKFNSAGLLGMEFGVYGDVYTSSRISAYSGSTGEEMLSIKYLNGFVGVNQPSPIFPLDVNGAIRGSDIKITTGAIVGYAWKCTNIDGSGAWESVATSERWIGTWDASSGSAPSGSPTTGDYASVIVPGTYAGVTYAVNDYSYYNGSAWVFRPNNYTLITATSSIKGGVKIGSTLDISSEVVNLKSGIATAGTYRSVTVDTYGRVTTGTNPTTIAGYGITDAYTKTETDAKYVDLTTAQSIAGAKGFVSDITVNGLTVGRGNNGASTVSGTAFGINALLGNTTGTNIVAIGWNSLKSNTTGFRNSSIGASSLFSNTTGNYNIGIGAFSMYSNISGSYNTATGESSLYFNTTGHDNTANGYVSLRDNTTGYMNTASGQSSLLENTTGNYNTASGYAALRHSTVGSGNTAFGAYAGRYITNGVTSNTTGTYSLFLGYDTRALADGQTNQIVIGYNTIGRGSNTVSIGNSNITDNYLIGNTHYTGTLKPSGTAPTTGQFLKASSASANVWATLAVADISDWSTSWDAKMATFIGAAPTALDTWLELVAEIQDTATDVTSLITSVATNASNLTALTSGLTTNYISKWNGSKYVNSTLINNGSEITTSSSITAYNLTSTYGVAVSNVGRLGYIDTLNTNADLSLRGYIYATGMSSFRTPDLYIQNDNTGKVIVGTKGALTGTLEKFNVDGNIKYSGLLKPNGTGATVKQVYTNNGTIDLFAQLDGSYITGWDDKLALETLTLTNGSFSRELTGLHLAPTDTQAFFVGFDEMSGLGLFRNKIWDDNDNETFITHGFDIYENGRFGIVTEDGNFRHYAFTDELGTSGGTVGTLQSVTDNGSISTNRLQYSTGGQNVNYALTSDIITAQGLQGVSEVGANSTIRLQYNGTNYATISDISAAVGIDGVLAIGNVATDRTIEFKSDSSRDILQFKKLDNTLLGGLSMLQADTNQVLLQNNESEIGIYLGSDGKAQFGESAGTFIEYDFLTTDTLSTKYNVGGVYKGGLEILNTGVLKMQAEAGLWINSSGNCVFNSTGMSIGTADYNIYINADGSNTGDVYIGRSSNGLDSKLELHGSAFNFWIASTPSNGQQAVFEYDGTLGKWLLKFIP